MKQYQKIIAGLVICLGLAALGFILYQNKHELTRFTEPTAVSQKPKTIVAIGDIACPPGAPRTDKVCHQAEVFAQIQKLKPSAVLLLGDLQYDKGEAANFKAVMDPLLGELKDKSLPAPGNHEYLSPNASGYQDFWKSHPLAQDIARTYYKYSSPDWEIFSLNSNCEMIGGCGEGSPQAAWLKQQLAAADRPQCTLAFWHHPVFTSGKYMPVTKERDRAKPLWEMLQQSSTDVVLNGHDHVYERFAKQKLDGTKDDVKGIRQFTVGTGGKVLYNFTGSEKNHEFGLDNTYGFLKLDLYKHYYKWAFMDEQGQIKDSGTTACTF